MDPKPYDNYQNPSSSGAQDIVLTSFFPTVIMAKGQTSGKKQSSVTPV